MSLINKIKEEYRKISSVECTDKYAILTYCYLTDKDNINDNNIEMFIKFTNILDLFNLNLDIIPINFLNNCKNIISIDKDLENNDVKKEYYDNKITLNTIDSYRYKCYNIEFPKNIDVRLLTITEYLKQLINKDKKIYKYDFLNCSIYNYIVGLGINCFYVYKLKNKDEIIKQCHIDDFYIIANKDSKRLLNKNIIVEEYKFNREQFKQYFNKIIPSNKVKKLLERYDDIFLYPVKKLKKNNYIIFYKNIVQEIVKQEFNNILYHILYHTIMNYRHWYCKHMNIPYNEYRFQYRYELHKKEINIDKLFEIYQKQCDKFNYFENLNNKTIKEVLIKSYKKTTGYENFCITNMNKKFFLKHINGDLKYEK